MTSLLDQAFAEAAKLPPQDQDAFAAWLIEELKSERRWMHLFASSSDTLEQLADEALAEFLAGKTDALDPDQL